MRDRPSDSKSEYGQRAREPWVAQTTWVSEGLGEGWVEVEPGIYRQKEPDDPAPERSPAEEPLEQTLRVAHR